MKFHSNVILIKLILKGTPKDIFPTTPNMTPISTLFISYYHSSAPFNKSLPSTSLSFQLPSKNSLLDFPQRILPTHSDPLKNLSKTSLDEYSSHSRIPSKNYFLDIPQCILLTLSGPLEKLFPRLSSTNTPHTLGFARKISISRNHTQKNSPRWLPKTKLSPLRSSRQIFPFKWKENLQVCFNHPKLKFILGYQFSENTYSK